MTAAPKYKLLSCYVVAWSMIISTPLACVSITYSVGSLLSFIMIPNSPEPRIQAAQLLVSCAQLGLPDYVAEAWHIYMVYLGMMLYVAAISDSPISVFKKFAASPTLSSAYLRNTYPGSISGQMRLESLS